MATPYISIKRCTTTSVIMSTGVSYVCWYASHFTSKATNIVKMYANAIRDPLKKSTPEIHVSPMTVVSDRDVFVHFL